MSEIVEITHNEQKFSFRTKETIKDASRIEREASVLAGGRFELAELTCACDEAIKMVNELNREKFGAEESKKKYRLYADLIKEGKTDSEEFKNLASELHANKYYTTWLELSDQRAKIYSYARLIALCETKPEGYDFYSQEPDELDKIVSLLTEQQVFFRKYER